MNKNILKYFGLAALLALGANAEAATIEVAAQDGLEEAIKSANAGDTIKLAAGTFSTFGTTYAQGKTLTFEGMTDGDGNLLTTWNYGNTSKLNGEHGADYSFEGSVVNFTNVKFHDNCNDGNAGYRGFVRLGGGSFTGCTFDTLLVYLGDGTVTFKECVFNMPDYCFWAYGIRSLNFDTCTFNSTAGKFINAYIEGAQAFDIGINIKDCTFNGGAVKYPAVKVKNDNNYVLAFTGTQTFNNVGTGSPTGSQYFDIQSGVKAGTTITIGGATVWANGAPVEQSSAVAKIGTTEYATINEAFAAVNSQSGDDVTIKILCDVTEELTADYIWKKNVTLSSGVDNGVTVNLGFEYGRGLWALIEGGDGKAMTIEDGVTITNLGQLFAGYYSKDSVVNVEGDVSIQQLWAYDSGIVNIKPTAKVVAAYGDGMIKLRYDSTVNVTGNGKDEVQFAAGYFSGDYSGAKVLNLTNTSVTAEWLTNDGDGSFTINMGNAKLSLNGQLNLGKSATGSINVSADSLIVANSISNIDAINIDATAVSEPVKVIDYTGDSAMTLADYAAAVNVTGGEAYVEDNDLWVKAKVEVVPEKPTEEEAKQATKVVDESGEVIEPQPEQEVAAKAEVEKVAQSFDNPEIAKVETRVAAAVMTVQGEGEEQKIVVKSAIVEELQKAAPAGTTDQITSESDVKSYVKVALGEAKVTVKDEGAALKSVTFDVKPLAETTIVTGKGTEQEKQEIVVAQIPNGEIKEPITFRLPLTDAFTVSAIVTHEGDPDRLCMVQGAAGGRYVEVTASHFSFFTVTPSEIVETTTESKTVLGIKRVDYTVTQSTADLAAAVPWLKAANEDMPVSQLITTGLSSGDTIQVYDLEQKTYYSWRYNGTAWEAVTLSTGVEVPPADGYVLKRGRAFWYKPVGGKGASGTYTQVGLYSEAAITSKVDSTALASASFANPVHFLMASPKYEDFNLKEKLTAKAGCWANDVVVIVATGARYRFNESAWGQDLDQEVDIFGVKVSQKVFVPAEGEVIVPAGTAFWYLSAGGAPEFEW